MTASRRRSLQGHHQLGRCSTDVPDANGDASWLIRPRPTGGLGLDREKANGIGGPWAPQQGRSQARGLGRKGREMECCDFWMWIAGGKWRERTKSLKRRRMDMSRWTRNVWQIARHHQAREIGQVKRADEHSVSDRYAARYAN